MPAFLEDYTVGMEGAGMQGLLEPRAANSANVGASASISRNAEQRASSANSNTHTDGPHERS